jgi:hypothetical protein
MNERGYKRGPWKLTSYSSLAMMGSVSLGSSKA